MVEEGRMTFNHAFRTSLSVTVLTATMSLGGCALFGHGAPIEQPTAPPEETTAGAPSAPELTPPEAAIQADAAHPHAEAAPGPAPPSSDIKSSAPAQYTVKR